MISRKVAARTYKLPYDIPENLPTRPLPVTGGLNSRNLARWVSIFPRDGESSKLSSGYIALIVILVLVLVANAAALGIFLYRRNRQRSSPVTQFSSLYPQERPQTRGWHQIGGEWFGKKPAGEDTQSLVGHQSRMPSITISRPISNNMTSGPTPIFNTKERESLHSVGIMELPGSAEHSPEAIYDPYSRSRSRSRANSAADSLQSSPRSRSTSPNVHVNRSRNSSISSNRSRSNSYTRPAKPLAQNSYSYARTRSPSNGPSHRGPHNNPDIVPETDEEYNIPETSSPSNLKREKSLPPPPHLATSPHKNSLSYIPSDPKNWKSDPYTEYCKEKPQFDFADYEVLQELTQVIDVAIAGPLDIPEGPLTPFGEREAKAGAALGLKSSWYKSPQNKDRGNWLV